MNTRIKKPFSSKIKNYNRYKVTKARQFNTELNESEDVLKKELDRENVIVTERQAFEFNKQNAQEDAKIDVRWYPYFVLEDSGKVLKTDENGNKAWKGEDALKEKVDKRTKEYKNQIKE